MNLIILALIGFVAGAGIYDIQSSGNEQVMELYVKPEDIVKCGDPLLKVRYAKWFGDGWTFGNERIIHVNCTNDTVYRVSKVNVAALCMAPDYPTPMLQMEKRSELELGLEPTTM